VRQEDIIKEVKRHSFLFDAWRKTPREGSPGAEEKSQKNAQKTGLKLGESKSK
jgi:hypothetical protein